MGASPELPPSLRSTELQHSKQVKHDAAICKVSCLALPCLACRDRTTLAGSCGLATRQKCSAACGVIFSCGLQ